VFCDKDDTLLVGYMETNTPSRKALLCISPRTEAATGLLTLRQAFKNNFVYSRQFCSSQSSHYATEVLKYLTNSPDLAPSDYYLYPILKKHLKGRKFLSTEEA
jgi:hypothetical protein